MKRIAATLLKYAVWFEKQLSSEILPHNVVYPNFQCELCACSMGRRWSESGDSEALLVDGMFKSGPNRERERASDDDGETYSGKAWIIL